MPPPAANWTPCVVARGARAADSTTTPRRRHGWPSSKLAAGTRGTCLPEEAHRRNALLVVIPASDIPIDARPEGMTETDAVGFWWRADDNVEVVLAPLPAAAP